LKTLGWKFDFITNFCYNYYSKNEGDKVMKVKIALETMNDVSEFVGIASQVACPVHLTSGDFKVSAKSLLGALYTMEWQEIWCECEVDIYHKIEKFIIV
jgi:hypothetical protein